MKLQALALLSLVLVSEAVHFYEVVKEEWEVFKLNHGKKYITDIEEKFRMMVFAENKHRIASHNKLHAQGHKSFKMKMNHFGDLLHHEFVGLMNGYRTLNHSEPQRGSTHVMPHPEVFLPKAVDWRMHGVVTPVKDQGQCGSCWAFSTTGALEGQHARATGKLVSLSEQNLVDCSTSFGNDGCNGGLMDNAFQYIKANGGIDTEASYPYIGMDARCHFNRSAVGAEDTGFVDIAEGNERALKAALATVGPVSVAIDASQASFQFYHHGVYFDENCSPENLDHGVLAVGYGKDRKTGEEYWIVKNSWSEAWGHDGYIYMARNRDNACGIASKASYPLV